MACWLLTKDNFSPTKFYLFLGGAVTGLITKLIGDWQELDTATHEGMQKNGKYNVIFIHRGVASNQILVGPGKIIDLSGGQIYDPHWEILLSVVPPMQLPCLRLRPLKGFLS